MQSTTWQLTVSPNRHRKYWKRYICYAKGLKWLDFGISLLPFEPQSERKRAFAQPVKMQNTSAASDTGFICKFSQYPQRCTAPPDHHIAVVFLVFDGLLNHCAIWAYGRVIMRWSEGHYRVESWCGRDAAPCSVWPWFSSTQWSFVRRLQGCCEESISIFHSPAVLFLHCTGRLSGLGNWCRPPQDQ